MLKINEIFYSIQGESSYTGLPTLFIRTTGCNLRCTYCDTKYSYHEGDFFSIEQLLEKIKTYKTKYICITGGEPLLQKEIHPFMDKLIELDYKVSLETSGAMDCSQVNNKVLKVIDIKTPDSGEVKKFAGGNLNLSPVNTEFKFVICSKSDFLWSEDFCRRTDLFEKFKVLYSPSYKQFSLEKLANLIIEFNLPVRLQCQLHKHIWGDDLKGV